ncbi:hypothetical protein NDU88_000631 [Pleurodeles waltl]|uniref:Uncharacterized protein n=1 Tax=Pleurodeles waltl TaxID=8319 RepID=A0AAV7UQJ4_PLEWA|nr:hypothetical protein NDU88_000631 [Pleurodeles waltl]
MYLGSPVHWPCLQRAVPARPRPNPPLGIVGESGSVRKRVLKARATYAKAERLDSPWPPQAAPGRAAAAMVHERSRREGNCSRGRRQGGCAASGYDREAPRSPGPRDADPERCPSRVPVRLPVMRA